MGGSCDTDAAEHRKHAWEALLGSSGRYAEVKWTPCACAETAGQGAQHRSFSGAWWPLSLQGPKSMRNLVLSLPARSASEDCFCSPSGREGVASTVSPAGQTEPHLADVLGNACKPAESHLKGARPDQLRAHTHPSAIPLVTLRFWQ